MQTRRPEVSRALCFLVPGNNTLFRFSLYRSVNNNVMNYRHGYARMRNLSIAKEKPIPPYKSQVIHPPNTCKGSVLS